MFVTDRDPPSNDNFADAIEVSGSGVTIGGTTNGATHEEFEPSPNNGYYTSASVWYLWTPSTR